MKCLVLEKITTGQTFPGILNLHCDLNLQHSNPILLHNTLAHDDVSSSHVWLQKDQHHRKYNRKSHVFIM